ncbi:1906_t:CDS:2 [Rhizophagus irregularis]|nr:1906_t:CDS:2 [Rhizophagus irregularis]
MTQMLQYFLIKSSKLCVAEIFRGAIDEKSEEEIDLLEECYFC